MREIIANPKERMELGHAGENGVTMVIFDIVKEWQAEVGANGTVQILVQMDYQEAYPAVVELQGDKAVWLVTAAETAHSGDGQVQLSYVVDGKVAKSCCYDYTILPSLEESVGTKPPHPLQSWCAHIEEIVGKTHQIDQRVTALDQRITALRPVPVPAYAIEEAKRVVKAVQSERTAKTLVLSAMSDWHIQTTGGGQEGENTRASAQLAAWGLKEIKRRMALDADLLLGDYSWAAANWTAAMVKADIDAVKELRPPMAACELWTRGNHDINYGAGRDRMLTVNELYSHVDANSMEDATNPGSGYCYRDFPRQKIRIVVLNTCDVYTDELPVPEPGKTVTSNWVSLEQYKWLGDHALRFDDKPDGDGWGVVLLSHHPVDYYGTCFARLMRLLEAYRDRSKGTLSYNENGRRYSYAYNFTTAKGKILCAINGHLHNFNARYISSSSSFPSLETNIAPWLLRVAVPNICDSRYNELGTAENLTERRKFGEVDAEDHPIYHRKTPGTAKGTSFDIISIDRDAERIRCTCYGAGKDIDLPFAPPTKTFKVTNNLTNVTTSNSASSVVENMPYRATLSPAPGHTFGPVTVTMGGVDITSTSVSGRVITIASVSGNIVVTATGVVKPSYTNVLPTSLAEDKSSVYGVRGIKTDTYISGSTGQDSSKGGVDAIGYIPCPPGSKDWPYEGGTSRGRCVLRFKNMGNRDIEQFRIFVYFEDTSAKAGVLYGHQLVNHPQVGAGAYEKNEDGTFSLVDITAYVQALASNPANSKDIKWIRVCSPGITDASIMTINEVI